MPEACTTTKLDKEVLLNVFRRRRKNLYAVLNRVGKSEISVLNGVRPGLSAPAAPPYPNIRLSIPFSTRHLMRVEVWLQKKSVED